MEESALRFSLTSVAEQVSRPVILLIAGLLLPHVLQTYQLVTLTLWIIYGILALSLSVVWGQGGIFSFGQTAFYGLAGYAFGVLGISLEPHSAETLTAFFGAVLFAALAAAALGYFMFYGRVGDVYVAIVTLATTLILAVVMTSTSGSQYTIGGAALGGYNGMINIPPLELPVPGHASTQLGDSGTYLFVLVIAVLIYGIAEALTRRPFGRVLSAVRTNETRTELLGYDVRRYKLIGFTVGGAIAGAAGALYAASAAFINPDPFSLSFAALVVIWVMVGGRTSLSGAFLGAIAVSGLQQYLSGSMASATPIILGGVLILIVLFLPGGVVPTAQGALRRIRPRAIRVTPAEEVPRPLTTRPSRLSTSGLSKRFSGLHAVDDVTLSFEPNRTYCIIGPNGAGKSTFFNLLTGRSEPTHGAIRYGDTDITGLLPYQRVRRGIGIKLQVPAIYPELPLLENLWLAAYGRTGDARLAEGIAHAVLEEVGLMDRAGLTAGQLAHGEQQWLEIGMVIAQAPQVILLDEPSAGMTRDETLRTVELIREIGRSATVIVVEHDMEFVSRVSAPVVVFHQGRVFTQGSFAEVRENPQVLDVYLGREAYAESQ